MAGNNEQIISAPFRGDEFGVVDSTPPTINQYHSVGGLVVRGDMTDPRTEKLDIQEDKERFDALIDPAFPSHDEYIEAQAYRDVVYRAQIASGKTEAEAEKIAERAAQLKFDSNY
jgi:hypothetical protein